MASRNARYTRVISNSRNRRRSLTRPEETFLRVMCRRSRRIRRMGSGGACKLLPALSLFHGRKLAGVARVKRFLSFTVSALPCVSVEMRKANSLPRRIYSPANGELRLRHTFRTEDNNPALLLRQRGSRVNNLNAARILLISFFNSPRLIFIILVSFAFNLLLH